MGDGGLFFGPNLCFVFVLNNKKTNKHNKTQQQNNKLNKNKNKTNNTKQTTQKNKTKQTKRQYTAESGEAEGQDLREDVVSEGRRDPGVSAHPCEHVVFGEGRRAVRVLSRTCEGGSARTRVSLCRDGQAVEDLIAGTLQCRQVDAFGCCSFPSYSSSI